MVRIGLISDTHGLLRPEALAFLHGADRVIHAGDIGSAAILEALNAIAPVTAVRGNNDIEGWHHLSATACVQVEDVLVFAIHDVKELRAHPLPGATRVVVCGHSHRPAASERGGVLYVNPGSAGPRRFRLPVSVAELIVDGTTVTTRLVELSTSSTRA